MTTRIHRRTFTSLALALALVAGYSTPGAQSGKAAAGTPVSADATAGKPLTIDDYTKWRTISESSISGDGKFVAYVLRQTNITEPESKPVLHLKNLETDEEITVAHASGAVFSPDSKWVAYQVDPGAAQRARQGRGGAAGGGGPGSTPGEPGTQPPAAPAQPSPTSQTPSTAAEGRGRGASTIPPRTVELRNLQTGTTRSWQDIGTFTFAATSTHLFLKRRAPEAAGSGGGGRGAGAPGGGGQGTGRGSGTSEPAGPRGLDVILLDLRTGRHQLLGSVADIAFNRTGELLAYTVDANPKDGNGIFVFETRSGRITTLDNDAKSYARLAWNEDGNAIAVLKGTEVEKMREKDNVLITFPNIAAAVGIDDVPAEAIVLDRTKVETFPKDWVISDRAPLDWSEDNKRVFFGIKPQVPAPPTERRSNDEAANVDVWNTADERIQSQQMIRADADRNFTFTQGFDVAAGRYIKLTDETMRDIDIAPDGRWAVGRDARGYIHDHKRPAADFYRVDTTTGERTLMFKGQLTGAHVFGITPHGRHFVYWKDNRFHAYDLERAASRPLGNGSTVNFVNTEFDHPGPRPSFGISGYTKDGRGAIASHKYDLWLLPFDGSAPKNLTGGLGAKNEVRLRYVRTEPNDPTEHRATGPRGTIDLSKPITLSAYGEWTKKAGFYELANGALKELIYEDAAFNVPVKAAKADRYLFTRQTFVEFPDLRVSGPGFRQSRRITDANPQQKEFTWGRRLLFDYRNRDGLRLQGILAIPDDYKPGEKRPMIVTFYEKNSQNLHRYNAPTYLTGMGGSPMEAVSRGYLTMMPDVHFRTGNSHSDMLECVEAATRKVIELGYADPKRIGVTGHSYGGEGAAFIGVMSKMFAAVGMGAGVTDLFNDFSQNWGWAYQYSGGSGANGNDYYLYGQGRWGFSPWDNPEKYRYESALTHAHKAQAPFLIMHGTSDPTVDFNNGLGFYNALRYNGKTAILLAYPGEGHGLRGMANRRDLTIRFFQFFDHYLKGEPAAKWMTDGVPFLKKDETKEPR